MLSKILMSAGQRLSIPGISKLISIAYPCVTGARRFVTGICRRSDGLIFDADSRELVDWQTIFSPGYERHLGELFAAVVHEGNTVIDVGANVGAHTLSLAHLVGTSGKVLAFEPNPRIHTKLMRNIDLNGFQHRVKAEQMALGFVNGSIELRVPKSTSREASNPGMASILALETPHDLVSVSMIRLDDYLEDNGVSQIQLVKMDVQGFEQPVFQGMIASLLAYRPILIFEFEDWAWAQSGSSWRFVYELLIQFGYALYAFGPGKESFLQELPANINPTGHLEVLALQRGDDRMKKITSIFSE